MIFFFVYTQQPPFNSKLIANRFNVNAILSPLRQQSHADDSSTNLKGNEIAGSLNMISVVLVMLRFPSTVFYVTAALMKLIMFHTFLFL